MQRRSFIAGIAALTVLRPAAAQRVYRVGTLVHGSEKSYGARLGSLRAALKTLGYVEGRNLVIVSRWNEGALERLPDLAAELLREKPDVVVCGPTLSSAAVQKHSSTVPIVQANGAGAVKIGLAKSFARPGMNVTGVETQTEDLTPKHIELLKALAPGVSRVAVLNTGRYLFHEDAWAAARKAATALKLRLVDVRVGTPEDLARLGPACAKGGCDGLYVMPDPSMINWREQVVAQAARLRLPAIYFQPEFVDAGGLASYSANVEDMWRRAAEYVDRIFKGAKPAEMPIERPTKFELVINLKAAKSLGLSVSGDLQARADRIIR